MSPELGDREFRGRALLDGVSALVPVGLEQLAPLRVAFPGVTLPTPDARGDVGVLVECWRVREGQPETDGIVQHALSESVGAASAAVVSGLASAALGVFPAGLTAAGAGAALGSARGPLTSMALAPLFGVAGAVSGGLLSGFRGARQNARLGGWVARAWSERVSRSFGSYNEVLISLPGVTFATRRYALVVTMLTDSLFARAVDRGLAYGFRKRKAAFVSREASLGVYAADHRPLLTLQTRNEERRSQAAAARDALTEIHALPLLGYVGAGNYTSSRLVRSTPPTGPAFEPCQASLTFAEDGLAPLAGSAFSVPAFSAGAAYGAVRYRDVLSRIGPPEKARADL